MRTPSKYTLYVIFLGLAIFFSPRLPLTAEEMSGGVEVFMGGKKFNSMSEYKRYKIEKAAKEAQDVQKTEKDPKDSKDSAGLKDLSVEDLKKVAEEVAKAMATLPGHAQDSLSQDPAVPQKEEDNLNALSKPSSSPYDLPKF